MAEINLVELFSLLCICMFGFGIGYMIGKNSQ